MYTIYLVLSIGFIKVLLNFYTGIYALTIHAGVAKRISF